MNQTSWILPNPRDETVMTDSHHKIRVLVTRASTGVYIRGKTRSILVAWHNTRIISSVSLIITRPSFSSLSSGEVFISTVCAQRKCFPINSQEKTS